MQIVNKNIVRLVKQNDKFFSKKNKNCTKKFSFAGNITDLKSKHFIIICKNKWDAQKYMAKTQIYL